MAKAERNVEPCRACRWFQRPRKIEWARHYATVARRLDNALADGALTPDPDGHIGPWTEPVPYTEMRAKELANEGMPDAFDYFFRCSVCGARFNLSCDIYHGAGGHWTMVE